LYGTTVCAEGAANGEGCETVEGCAVGEGDADDEGRAVEEDCVAVEGATFEDVTGEDAAGAVVEGATCCDERGWAVWPCLGAVVCVAGVAEVAAGVCVWCARLTTRGRV
jgi:hypothetical protein